MSLNWPFICAMLAFQYTIGLVIGHALTTWAWVAVSAGGAFLVNLALGRLFAWHDRRVAARADSDQARPA